MKFNTKLATVLTLAAALLTTVVPTSAGAAFDSRLPVGDLPGWHQTFTEGFDVGVSIGGFTSSAYYMSKFRAYGPTNSTFTSWRDSAKHGWYMPQIISVENGALSMHIQTVNGRPYVAALVPELAESSPYGRYSVRMRSDSLPAYKLAYMLWPVSGDNERDGEIDFPEKNLDSTSMFGFMHKTNQTSGPVQQGYVKNTSFDSSVYHVYTIEWSPNLVTLILDGVPIQTFTERIPSTPFRWVMQAETRMNGGAPMPAASTNGDVQIAWIAAWSYAP